MRGTPASRRRPAATAIGRTWRRAGDWDHHRRGAHHGGRDGELRPGCRRAWPPMAAADGADQAGAREWYGDSAYGTGVCAQRSTTSARRRNQAQATDRARGGRVHVDDFTINEPAVLPRQRHPPAEPDPGSQLWCAVCTRLSLCSCGARASKTGRKIVLHQQDDMLRAARRDCGLPTLNYGRSTRKNRPNVETVPSQIRQAAAAAA